MVLELFRRDDDGRRDAALDPVFGENRNCTARDLIGHLAQSRFLQISEPPGLECNRNPPRHASYYTVCAGIVRAEHEVAPHGSRYSDACYDLVLERLSIIRAYGLDLDPRFGEDLLEGGLKDPEYFVLHAL